MAKTLTVFTVITFLLFAVSTAFNPTFIPTLDDKQSTADQVKLPDPAKETQTFIVNPIDQTPRIRLTRSNQFNRHVFNGTTLIPLRFVRRHPCRKFMRSYGNDMIASSAKTETVTFDPKKLGDDEVIPIERLEFKHKYGHVHGHHDDDDEFETKYEVDGEKFERHHHHKKEEKNKREHEHKGGFMKSVRKFLKHTFD